MLRCGEFLPPCCDLSLISGSSSPRAFPSRLRLRWIRAGCCLSGFVFCTLGSSSSSPTCSSLGSTLPAPVCPRSPLITAATFWTRLWGPIGLLLSTPLTVCLVVLGRHVPQLVFLELLLGDTPVLAPDETFYQRLLANDPEEATKQAEEFVKERPLAEFFDEVVIPALLRAQAVATHRDDAVYYLRLEPTDCP